MKRRGFTLVELLAVIVILAVIALISVPMILGVIEKSKKNAFKVSVMGAMQSVQYYLINNSIDELGADGVSVSDLDLKNKEQFIAGKIIENDDNQFVAVKITDGEYCASGTIDSLVITSDCYTLDTTEPIIDDSKISTSSTSNSITIVLADNAVTEEESDIKNYTYKIVNEDLGINEEVTSNDNNYTFSNLKNGVEYEVYFIATNTNNLTSTKEYTITTSDISVPTYVISTTSWAPSKTVTITYPERQDNFIYSYSRDGGTTWTTVEDSNSVVLTFTSNGTVIARVYDGTNYVTASSFTVSNVDLYYDSFEILAYKAGLDINNYASTTAFVYDSTAMNKVMNTADSLNYMITGASSTKTVILNAILSSTVAMTQVIASRTALIALASNSLWLSSLKSSSNYTSTYVSQLLSTSTLTNGEKYTYKLPCYLYKNGLTTFAWYYVSGMYSQWCTDSNSSCREGSVSTSSTLTTSDYSSTYYMGAGLYSPSFTFSNYTTLTFYYTFTGTSGGIYSQYTQETGFIQAGSGNTIWRTPTYTGSNTSGWVSLGISSYGTQNLYMYGWAGGLTTYTINFSISNMYVY